MRTITVSVLEIIISGNTKINKIKINSKMLYLLIIFVIDIFAGIIILIFTDIL
jgi:hypothetical protein